MKALSINQPWAWAIVMGHKPVENRDWNTSFRGEFLVHAGLRFDREGYDFIKDHCPDVPIPDRSSLERHMGGIVGKARLIHVVPNHEKHLLTEKDRRWYKGPYGLMLDSTEPLALQPCKGQLGFFIPDFNSRYKEKTKWTPP